MGVYIEDTTFYNKGSSVMLGWDPTWFGLSKDEFGPKLETAIKEFQKSLGVKEDGLVGPITYARLETAREALSDVSAHLNCGLKEVSIEYPKVDVETFYQKLPSGNYKHVSYNKPRNVNKIVVHWDAALSAQSCFNILKKRGYSTHFAIDNDGTICQFLNTNHIAYHVKESNKDSIGIDISNAFYLKYNKTYEKRGFGKRPVITSTVNGQIVGPHLGYYPEQIRAAKELIKVLCKEYDIPLEIPAGIVTDPENTPGVMFHYHLNDGKIDTAGFPLDLIISELKNED